MKTPVLLALLVLSQTADAATLRMRFHASTGELVDTAKPCGAEVRSQVWHHLRKGLFVQIADGVMTVAVGSTKERVADRVVVASSFVGFYDDGDRSIAITVRRSDIHKGKVPVELAILLGPDRENRCTEKWVGLATLL